MRWVKGAAKIVGRIKSKADDWKWKSKIFCEIKRWRERKVTSGTNRFFQISKRSERKRKGGSEKKECPIECWAWIICRKYGYGRDINPKNWSSLRKKLKT